MRMTWGKGMQAFTAMLYQIAWMGSSWQNFVSILNVSFGDSVFAMTIVWIEKILLEKQEVCCTRPVQCYKGLGMLFKIIIP